MLDSLKIDPEYDGFLFLAESVRNPPILFCHRHVELELNLVANGEITYVVDGRTYTSGRGTLLWLFPSQEHQIVNRTSDAEYYVAVFKPEMIAESCTSESNVALRSDLPTEPIMMHTILDPQRFGMLQNLMNEMMVGSIDADVLNREAGFGIDSSFRYRHSDPDGLNAGLRYLLTLSWRYQQMGPTQAVSAKLHPCIRKALSFITERRHDDSLEVIAKNSGVSAAYLSRLFTRQVGIPLNQYKNNVRLGRFWDCYNRDVSMTVSEAAFDAGFGSYAQFYKVFREQYGSGPSQLLKTRT